MKGYDGQGTRAKARTIAACTCPVLEQIRAFVRHIEGRQRSGS